MSRPLLEVRNLHVSIAEDGHRILNGIDLVIRAGEVHALMGPNGSGKSTLAHVLAGRPGYEVTEGEVLLRGKGPPRSRPEESGRAKGSSSPSSTPSRSRASRTSYFLRTAVNAVRKHRGLPELDAMDFLSLLDEKAKLVEMEERMLERGVNEGFSGGEKKRNEILQMAMLDPRLAILDETDSGLDIDALRVVGLGRQRAPEPRARDARHHALPAAALLHRPGRRPRPRRRADRRRRAARSWRSSWRRRATPGSAAPPVRRRPAARPAR